MNSTLKDFFNEERKRVFEPGPYFTQRVMARLSERLPVFWDLIPRATRPVMAVALVLLFGVLAAQILIPVEPPTRGPIETTLFTQDLTAREHMLFIDPQLPAGVQFEEWTLLEPTP
jgi:hypothetical protein